MPTFRTAPSGNFANALKRLIQSGGAQLSPVQEMQADQAAAETARSMSLAEKARAEVEAMRRAEADRTSPELATEYAGNAAGLDMPTATRLANHLRGVLEQPSAADIQDAEIIGETAKPYRTGAPNIEPGQRRSFQSALASTLANRLASGDTNAAQLAQSGRTINDTALVTQAANEPDLPTANRLVAAIHGKIRTPYSTNAQGTVLNDETGALNEGGQLAGAVRGHVNAQTATEGARAEQARSAAGASRAAAGASSAHARLYDAQTANEKVKSATGAPFKDVTTLRKEFNDQPEVKAYRDVLPIIESARTTPDTRAGDIQLAYAVGKILDPNSVVREGELKLVGDAATIPERVQGQIRTLVMGKGRMTPATRAELVRMLDVAVAQRERSYKATEATYRGIAEQNRFPVEQVIIDPPGRSMAPLPTKPTQATNSRGWKLMTDAAGNKAYVSPDGTSFEEVK